LEIGLILKNGIIENPEDSPFPRDGHDLLQVFRYAQIREAQISANLHSLIRRHLKLIDRKLLYSKRARDIFLSILHSKGEVGRILRMMHECGLLGEYIPEFGRLDCLVQHEFYHRYTADEHTLVAIEKLDEILNAKEGVSTRYSRIFQQLENAQLLYLAILTHDTGKAYHIRHHADASTACAQQIARRFCLDHESRRTLIWLVDHHSTMSSIAQRRDIEDPSTIEDMMELVETRGRLDMLHLLTFVDGQAVGSTNWNEWRQSILWQLYESTAKALSTSGVEQINIQTQKETLRNGVSENLSSAISKEEVESHFTHMPQRYWRRVEQQELSWHLEIIHEFFESLLDEKSDGTSPIIKWRHFPDRGYSEAVVCTWDRHGLFAKIAGSLAAARLNILNADIYTRSDDIVLDIFQVCDLEHHAIKEGVRTHKMSTILSESLSGITEIQFGTQILREYESMRTLPYQHEERFPTAITFNNEDSPDYTILEIQTPDRLGLLYHILEVLGQCGIDIYLAKINTEKGAAMDVFYLTDTEGRKLTDVKKREHIQHQLRETINHLNQPFRIKA
jgi:[protein-PII] uridylyltransferase